MSDEARNSSTRKMSKLDLKKSLFYQLPKFLYLDSTYKNMSNDSKVLYAMYMDRTKLSLKNNRIDEHGNVYINFKNDKAMELLNIRNEKLSKIKKELRNYGLIEEVRPGLRQVNRIYVLVCNNTNIDINEYEDDDESDENRISRNSKIEFQEVRKSNYLGSSKIEFQEVRKSNTSNTNINNTKNNTNINIEQTKETPEIFFDKIWSLYPAKKGKAKVNKKSKEYFFGIGFEKSEELVNRYLKYVDEKRKEFPQLNYQNGSTFFNSGYVDYLDENYAEYKATKVMSNQPAQATNYEQRGEADGYDDDFFNSLYDNVEFIK